MPSKWQQYGKAFAAVIAAALVVAYNALSGDKRIEPDEWVHIAIAFTIAVGVYLVPLAPEYRWAKTALAAVLAGLEVLVTAVLGGLEPGEWIAILLAVATVLGVGGAPAVSDNGVSAKGPGAAVAP